MAYELEDWEDQTQALHHQWELEQQEQEHEQL